jgi:hypothetical protein
MTGLLVFLFLYFVMKGKIMKINATLLLVPLIIGIVLGYVLFPSPDIIEETTTTSRDTVFVKDTIYVDVVKPEKMAAAPESFEVVEVAGDSLIKSTQTFEMENFDVRVDAYAKCQVELIEIELLNIKPMRVVIEKEIVTIEKLKTVVIDPAWYETRTTGIIIGVVGTVTLVWAAGQIAN